MSIIKNYLKQNKVTHTFSDCQWPIGDPQEKDFHFCEAETLTGKPYCKEHCDVAYIDERELKKEKEAQKNRRIAAYFFYQIILIKRLQFIVAFFILLTIFFIFLKYLRK